MTLYQEPKNGVADYLLTPRALKDLDAIADYSLERWGHKKTREYLTALTDRMQWLAEDPGRGHPRDDIDAGYRCFGEGQHLIFYVRSIANISIIGVPHGSEVVAGFRTID
jgi:toxin ParE1/3/4